MIDKSQIEERIKELTKDGAYTTTHIIGSHTFTTVDPRVIDVIRLEEEMKDNEQC